MAAATIASTSRTHIQGDMKTLFRSYTALANTNTDTLPTGTNIIGINVLTCTTSASVTATVASNVITYNVSAGTPDVKVEIMIGPE